MLDFSVKTKEPEPYRNRKISEFLPENIIYEIWGSGQGLYSIWFIGDKGKDDVIRIEVETDKNANKALSWSIFDRKRNLIHKEVLKDGS